MKITPELLRQALGCRAQDAERAAEPLSVACAFYGIDTLARLAAFLAQIGHESEALRYTTEIWGPTPAQQRYEGREDLGNTTPGDGKRFKGRGYLQNTGRYNYARVRDRLRERFPDVPDFEAEPERLAEPIWAALAAADFWDDQRLNDLADAGEFVKIGRAINRGNPNSQKPANGEADRIARWERVKRALQAAADARTPVPDYEPIPPTPQQEASVAPFLAAAVPALIQAAPALARIFSSGSETAERNIKAVEVVAEMAKDVTGARNEQELIEVLERDPEAREAVRKVVETNWFQIQEAGGSGIDGARRFSADVASSGVPLWRQPAFIISCLVLVFPLMLAVDLFFVHPESYDSNMRTQVITAFLAAISVVAAFWLGSSFGSQKKDERRA